MGRGIVESAMNILIVSSGTPVRGGVATYVDMLAEGMRRKSHKVKVINLVSDKSSDFKLYGDGFVNFVRVLTRIDQVFRLMLLAARMMIYVRCLKEININSYDVVHAQDVNSCLALGGLCKRKGLRLILSVHGHVFTGNMAVRSVREGSPLSKQLKRLEIAAYKRASHILAVSRRSLEFIENYVDSDKVSITSNFIDISQLCPLSGEERQILRLNEGFSEDDFVLVYAGRLVKTKGLRYIIDAVRSVRNSLPVKLIIAGKGEMKTDIQRFINDNSLQQVIAVKGEIPREQVIDLYHISDCFVMASVSDKGPVEGSPIALLEAMACGIPVITTGAGGIGEIARHGENALVVRERDTASIAAAVRVLYSDSDLRKRIAKRALEDVRCYHSADAFIDMLCGIYSAEGGEKCLEKS